MKNKLILLCVGLFAVAASVYSVDTQAEPPLRDNIYECRLHGDLYAMVVGHNTPCPILPQAQHEELFASEPDHDVNDPACLPVKTSRGG